MHDLVLCHHSSSCIIVTCVLHLHDPLETVDWSKFASSELDKFVAVLDQYFRSELIDILQSAAPNRYVCMYGTSVCMLCYICM